MSADNWAICPRCKVNADKAVAAAKSKAEKSYGKVSAAEYADLLAKANAPVKLEQTLREDYELGVDEDGTFEVGYSCFCTYCDFSFQHKHEAEVPLNA